ncbi:MAG: hypothetical protein JXJ19_06705 [Elusimicrobia bacterium]|nr:hypothetical protein [Elusimicrobiota bacterium]
MKDRNIKNRKDFKIKNNWELLQFLFIVIKENKKWWLLPLLLIIAFLGLFISLTGNTSVLPAIYALF